MPVTIIVLFLFLNIGFYTVKSSEDYPDGKTFVIIKGFNEPTFFSPEGYCMEKGYKIDKDCTDLAQAYFTKRPVLFKFPYWESAYNNSIPARNFASINE